MNPVTYVIINLATVVLIWVGAVRVDTAIITQGAVVALINYMSQILVELIKLANLIINITKALACASRVQGVLDTESPWKPPGPFQCGGAEPGTGYLSECGSHLPGAGAASLSGLSFSVKPGETVGVIGGTGSGKSSLVNLIPRFYDATQGDVLVDGHNVRDYPLASLREKVGVVPQKAVLFTGTIRDNLKWGKPDATDEELWQAWRPPRPGTLWRKNPAAWTSLCPRGEELLRRPAAAADHCPGLGAQTGDFDFGRQRQRPGLCHGRPAAESDPPNGGRAHGVHRVPAGLVHSGMRTRSIVLDDGEVRRIGTHEELLKHCEVYREIFESQFQREERGATA